MPLLRVTDMKYEQSALGRTLNYGTFVLESAGQDQALREVKHLPNPNELYLRVVEEMYEPQAVEARLGKDGDAGDDA
jgi:Bacterial PH domain